MLKNVANQTWQVLAFNDESGANGTPGALLTGIEDTITAEIELDDGTPVATDDEHPTPVDGKDGFYKFSLSQAETNANQLRLYPVSSIPGVRVIAAPATIFPSTNIAPTAPYNAKNGKIELTRLSDYKTGTPVGPLLIPITANNVSVGDVVRFGAQLEDKAEQIYVEGSVVSSDGAFYGSFEIEGSTVLDKTPSEFWTWGMEHVNANEDETAVAADKPMTLLSDRVVDPQ